MGGGILEKLVGLLYLTGKRQAKVSRAEGGARPSRQRCGIESMTVVALGVVKGGGADRELGNGLRRWCSAGERVRSSRVEMGESVRLPVHLKRAEGGGGAERSGGERSAK